jgi:geranylgeranyl diphosphate synthase, type II
MNTKTHINSFTDLQQRYKPLIDSYLINLIKPVPDHRQIIIDAALHSINAGGKRIRPLLSLSTALLLNKSPETLLPFAAAIEMIHTYSLIHDDLPAMDNDDLRRGKPTCHIKYGEDIAILTGDLLQTLAFETLSNPQPHIEPSAQLNCIHLICNAIGNEGMIGGQVLDINHESGAFNIEALKNIHSKKTGALIEISLLGPAILLNATQEQQRYLSQLGKHLGLLFQITDDILDETGSKEEIGKSPGKDKEQNKLTYTTLLGLDNAKEMATNEAKKALTLLIEFKSPYTTLFSTLIQYFLKRTY